MNRHFAGEAVAAGFLRLAAKRCGIAEIDGNGIDGLPPRRCGAGEAERAREPVWIEKTAVAVAVRLGAELGRKIFRAPGQALEPRTSSAIGAGQEQRGGGF